MHVFWPLFFTICPKNVFDSSYAQSFWLFLPSFCPSFLEFAQKAVRVLLAWIAFWVNSENLAKFLVSILYHGACRGLNFSLAVT